MAEQKAKVVKVGRGGPRGPRPKVQNPGKIFMRILRYVMECYRIQVVAVVICIFVSVFANVQGTLFMQTLIDGYILPLLKEQSSDFSGLAHAIARTAGFYGIGIVAAFASRMQSSPPSVTRAPVTLPARSTVTETVTSPPPSHR